MGDPEIINQKKGIITMARKTSKEKKKEREAMVKKAEALGIEDAQKMGVKKLSDAINAAAAEKAEVEATQKPAAKPKPGASKVVCDGCRHYDPDGEQCPVNMRFYRRVLRCGSFKAA